MAINKITAPAATPAAVADYQAQNNLLIALLKATQIPRKAVEIDSTWYIRKGTIFYVGGSTYYVDANTNISGTATPYIKLTPSEDGSTLSASYVTNLTGVSWNDEYSGYYDSSGNYYIFGEVTAIVNGQISEIKYDYFTPAALGTNWIPALMTALGSEWLTALVTELGSGWAETLHNHSLFFGGPSLPTASSTYYRSFFLVFGGAGADTLYYCKKDSGLNYKWYSVNMTVV